jgi:long-chain acyl-CoA synthetase
MGREEKTLNDKEGEAPTPGANLPVLREPGDTINMLFDTSCLRFSDFPAIGMALEDPMTYGTMHRMVLVLAARLQADGVVHGQRVALLAENSHHWGIAYLAIVRLGAIGVPILPDLPEADVHHILGEMQCDIIFTTQRQIEKIYELKHPISRIIMLDDDRDEKGTVEVTTFSEYVEKARETFAELVDRDEVDFPEVIPTDVSSILYTSGTSGFSKAVVLTHANLTANANSAAQLIHFRDGMVFLSVLPISHTYEFTVGFLLPLLQGCRIIYAGKTPTPAVLQKICAAERPHVMLVVPLVMEKIYKKRVLPAVEKSKLLTFCCRFRVGRRVVYRKIGAKLIRFFGDQLEIMGIGGAALNPEVERFLEEANFPYLIGYGMTESAPLIAGGPMGDSSIVVGTTGKPIPNVEVRIDDPDPNTGIGEVLVRGPNVMQGYWDDPEATEDTFTEDGWLRTGDMGKLDGSGNLYIKGRFKSVIVMANGENIYPEAIEHKINAYPFVVESLVIDNNGKLEAWVYPDYEFIDGETTGQNRQQRHTYISSLLDQVRTEVNGEVSVSSRLSRILERREPFIKTATHKIKRYLYSATEYQDFTEM